MVLAEHLVALVAEDLEEVVVGLDDDAVEMAVSVLEDSPLFNAGRGSVFTANGTHEMDAAIMCGRTLEAGAVSLVEGVRNPIRLARTVMDASDHVFLAGSGAMEFAKQQGLRFEDPKYFYDQLRYDQWQEIKDTDSFQLDHSLSKDRKFGTVGAVACDSQGHLASATSTGGMTSHAAVVARGMGKPCVVGCGKLEFTPDGSRLVYASGPLEGTGRGHAVHRGRSNGR